MTDQPYFTDDELQAIFAALSRLLLPHAPVSAKGSATKSAFEKLTHYPMIRIDDTPRKRESRRMTKQ